MPEKTLAAKRRTHNDPLIFSVRERGEIRIHRSVMRALNSPDGMCFWWSEQDNALLVSAANGAMPISISVPHSCRCRKNGVRFTNRGLLEAICILAGWEERTAHRLLGEFLPDLNMVAFRLNAIETVGNNDE